MGNLRRWRRSTAARNCSKPSVAVWPRTERSRRLTLPDDSDAFAGESRIRADIPGRLITLADRRPLHLPLAPCSKSRLPDLYGGWLNDGYAFALARGDRR